MESQPFSSLELIVSADPGNRGIGPLIQSAAIERAARSLMAATKVVITTGFFIPLAGACETDGPPGALALATALRRLDIDVLYLADNAGLELFRAAGLEPVQLYREGISFPDASHLLSIERLGRAADGRYYNMRAIDITTYSEPIDQVFLDRHPGQVTIGIGDGGNEIGMGQVADLVRTHIRFGETIASTIAVDHLIVAGVSNWGAWGLAAALSLLASADLLPTEEEAYADLAAVVAAGGVDGVTTEATTTVDGLAWPVHADVLHRLRAVLTRAGI
jgi:hypothetical protein